MLILTENDVSTLLTVDDARTAMRAAFTAFGQQRGALMERTRIKSHSGTLSVMGAILENSHDSAESVMGIKAYPTINGQFTFQILLFSGADGRPLALIPGGSMTALRTAAVTRLAFDELVAPNAKRLALFGTGIQARAHALALTRDTAIEQIDIVGVENTDSFAQQVQTETGVQTHVSDAASAIAAADVIVTATRATKPLFDGNAVNAKAFVAAIGSSKPDVREIDDALLRRAAVIAVESRTQTLREAGEFALAASGAVDPAKIVELGELAAGTQRDLQSYPGIRFFKSVGVGISDVALAHLAYRRARERGFGTVA